MKALVTILYFLLIAFGASLLTYLVMQGHSQDAGGGVAPLLLFTLLGGFVLAGWLFND